MIIQGNNQFNHSFIKISLKPNIYKEYMAKFQINDCFENFTHAHIILHIILNNLPNIFKDLPKIYSLFHSFFKEIYQNQPFLLFKHVYLNSVW